jgi:uncharacterized membrane protein YccC
MGAARVNGSAKREPSHIARFRAALFSYRPKRSDWIFAVRATAASVVALSIAYALKLENPQWAMLTVFVVAQPVAGMVLAKGLYRLLGTLVGASGAIAINLASHGSPLLFLTLLALWVWASSFGASMLRNPEAYGAALAGYTAVIVGLPAFGHGELVIEIARARTIEIMLGIACAGLASRLILPQFARDQMTSRLRGIILDLSRYAEGAFTGAERATLVSLSRKLIGDIEALGEMRAYVRLESPSLAAHGHSVRRTIGYLLSAVSAARMLRNHRPPPDTPPTPARIALHGLVADLRAAGPAAFDDLAPWIERCKKIAEDARAAPAELARDDPDRIGTAARLSMAVEFAEMFAGVLRGLEALRSPGTTRRRERSQPAILVHRDARGAFRNGVRAAAATTLVALFWLETQWEDAAGVTVMVAVVSILFASRPSPIQTSFGFFKGTLLAVPFAFLTGQILLPALPGIFWFVVVVAPVLVVAALAMANPRWTGTATAFAVNYLVFLSPHQTMVYAPQAFLNGAVSLLLGILLAMGVFAVVLPSRPREAVARLASAIREDLVRLCVHDRIPRRSAFESLAYDRINQLMPYNRGSGSRTEAILSGSVSSVTVGLEILKLRRAIAAGAVPTDVKRLLGRFLKRLARLLLKPTGEQPVIDFVNATRDMAARIARDNDSADVLDAAASLRVIAAAVEDHPAFFRRVRRAS